MSTVPRPRTPSAERARDYMRTESTLADTPVDVVFIGSCTNGRLPDLRAAADVMRGRKVKSGVRALVVPGSEAVRQQAEAEGLHDVFIAAGAEWRLPGCSMCIAMNGAIWWRRAARRLHLQPQFRGPARPGRAHGAGEPGDGGASAIAGRIADPRPYLGVQ